MEKLVFVCDLCKKKVEVPVDYILTGGVPYLGGQFIPANWICLECKRHVVIEVIQDKE